MISVERDGQNMGNFSFIGQVTFLLALQGDFLGKAAFGHFGTLEPVVVSKMVTI